MKFTATKHEFLKAIMHANLAVDGKSMAPIIGCILLEASDGAVGVAGTDISIMIESAFAADVSSPGSTAVPATTLVDVVKRMHDDMPINVDVTGNRMKVSCGRLRSTIDTLDSADFPKIDGCEKFITFDISRNNELSLFKSCMHAASDEETRYYLCGTHISACKNNNLVATATNGHVMTRNHVKIDGNVSEFSKAIPGGIIVPKKTCAIFNKVSEFANGQIQLGVSEVVVRLSSSTFNIVSKVIDRTFPDCDRVVPKNNNNHLTVLRSDILDAIKFISGTSGHLGSGITLETKENSLRLYGSTQGSESFAEIDLIKKDCDGDIEIIFTGRYLLDIVDSTAGNQVFMSMTDPESPAIISAFDGCEYFSVLMPRRKMPRRK